MLLFKAMNTARRLYIVSHNEERDAARSIGMSQWESGTKILEVWFAPQNALL